MEMREEKKEIKKFENLTNQEVLDLSKEELLKYVNLAKLEEGIPLQAIEVKEPVLEELPEPTEKLFYSATIGYKMATKDVETLTTLLDLVRSGAIIPLDYTYVEGDPYYYIDKNTPYYSKADITEVSAYRNYGEVSALKGIIERNKAKSTAKVEADTFSERSAEIEERIFGRVEKISTAVYYAKQHLNIFKNEYLPLADHDIDKALAFYTKAYSISDDVIEFLYSENINHLVTE